MTPNEELPGGLHFDGSGRDVQVGPSTGIIRYYPVSTAVSAPAPARRSIWWHVLGSVVGVAGACLVGLVGGYGLPDARPYWLYALAGVLAGTLVFGARLSRAVPVAAGLTFLAIAVLAAIRPELLGVFHPGGLAAGLAGVFLVVGFLRSTH